MRTIEFRDSGTYPALTPVTDYEHRLIMQANEERRLRAQGQVSEALREEYPRIAIETPTSERVQKA